MNYHAIRGKFDFPPLLQRRKGRSKYGAKNLKKAEKKSTLPDISLAEKVERYRYLRYGYSLHGRHARRF